MDAWQRWIDLLGLPFLACVAMTAILGYLGLHVLKREIVFVDIALAQIVAVGAIGAHVLFEAQGDSPLAHACALGLAVVAAAFYAITRRRVVSISTEAVIGVSYAIAAAAALFLLGVAPGGHVHAQHMLTGSILWASWSDLALAVIAFGGVGLCFTLLRKPFARLSGDYQGAIDGGMNVVWWDFLFYCLIGVVITFAVRIGGVVVVFCLLIIPASISILFASGTFARLSIAWLAGIAGSVLGLIFADRLDFSVGPSVALLLGIGLAIAAGWRVLAPAAAGAITVVTAAGYAILLALAPAPVGSHRPPDWCQLEPETESSAERTHHEVAVPTLAGSEAPEGFVERYELATDARERSDTVVAALDAGSPEGARLALRFLEDDPPLFFRQRVVDRLNEGATEAIELDVGLPFADPENREAAEVLRRMIDSRP